MKKIVVLVLLAIVLAPCAAAQWSGYTFHVQNSSATAIFHATVYLMNHSAQLTDDKGNAVFNVEATEFPITIAVSAPGYNESGLITYEDSATTYQRIILVESPNLGSGASRGAGALCGLSVILSACLCCVGMIVSRKVYQPKP